MKLIDELFRRYKANVLALSEYGFEKTDNVYSHSLLIHHGDFRLILKYSDGVLNGKLVDTVFEDEYSQIDQESSLGFIAELKEECTAILVDIRDRCFIKEVYLFEQTNRIDQWINKTYHISCDFPFQKLKDNGVYRNKETKKWFGLIMNLAKNKLIPDGTDKEVEVMNLHLGNETKEYLKRKGIYPCFHMNKKYWVSIILDDTLKDDEIFSLIDISYQLSKKK